MKTKSILCIIFALSLSTFQVEAGAVKAAAKAVGETVEAAVKHGGSIFGKTAKSKAGREILEEATKKYGDDVVEETVEIAAKRSGKTLAKTTEATIGEELIEAVGKYGDDVIPLVREGGLEVLEQGAKHGDDFWRLCKEVPAASRAMALHADELIPLAKRIGPEVLEVEAKTPGMATKLVREFGDDAVKTLAKHPDDTTRLVGYAAKADSPETAQLLYKTYKDAPNPTAFLERLDRKQILAYGLSASMIVVAAGGVAPGLYQIGNGIQQIGKGMNDALKNPETANHTITLIICGLFVFLALVISPFIVKRIRKCRNAWKEQNPPPKDI